MNHSQSLIQIGSKATVDLSLVQDRIPSSLVELLTEDPVGTVIDYKMTDGTGIGLFLELSDGTISWFFQEELGAFQLEALSSGLDDDQSQRREHMLQKIALTRTIKHKSKRLEKSIIMGKTIIDLLNPFNFLRWLAYSLKDV